MYFQCKETKRNQADWHRRITVAKCHTAAGKRKINNEKNT